METGSRQTKPPSVRVLTLGTFEVMVEGAPPFAFSKSQLKPLELLKVLIALGGRTVSVETLCDSLWPDKDGDEARGAFSIALHRLRRIMGAGTLLLHDGRLTLSPEYCWVDALALADLVEVSERSAGIEDSQQAGTRMEELLKLYRGPFLLGEFDPPEILTAREKLHGQFCRHIQEVGKFLQENGEGDKAIALYRMGLEIDPLAEDFAQELMRCYGHEGRTAEALAVYRRCQEALQAMGGSALSPATEALHQELLTRTGGGDLPNTPAPLGKALPTPGRQRPRHRNWLLSSLLAAAVVAGMALGWKVLPGIWKTGGESGGGSESAGEGLMQRPSLAVLPFANLTGDPAQTYLSDGFSENLITTLAKIPQLLVIARNSSFVYKDRPKKVQEVARDLGVRYLLEGSLQGTGGRIRVTAQLIDSQDGRHLWSENFDRERKNLMAVQDEVILKIAKAIQVKLTQGERQFLQGDFVTNPRVWEIHLKAQALSRNNNKVDNLRAREHWEKALALEPSFPSGLTGLAATYLNEARFYSEGDTAREAWKRTEEYARKALAINDKAATGHNVLAQIYAYRGEYEQAMAEGQLAVKIAPSHPQAIKTLALLNLYLGHPKKAEVLIQEAMRVHPYYPPQYLAILERAYYLGGEYEKAIATARKRRQWVQGNMSAPAIVVVSLVALGREAEAREEAAKILVERPQFTSHLVARKIFQPYRDPEVSRVFVARLRRGGLPE